MSTAYAVGLAVLGAVCFAGAAYLQHDAVRHGLRQAVRRPAWLAGLGLIGVGATLHAVALAVAPLVVVQPVGVLALPLVAVLHVRGAGARLGLPTLTAIGATTLGVALFVTVAATVTTTAPPSAAAYGRACWLAGFAVIALVGAGVASVGRARCLAYATAAGVAFALVSLLVRAIGQPLASGTWQIPLVAPVGIAVALAVGGVLVQLGYASGPPAVVIACLTIVDPLVSVGIGVGLFDEAASATTWTLLAGTASALIAVAGTVALARHHPEVAARTSPPPGTHEPTAAGDSPLASGQHPPVGTARPPAAGHPGTRAPGSSTAGRPGPPGRPGSRWSPAADPESVRTS